MATLSTHFHRVWVYCTNSLKAGSVLLYRALPLMCPRMFQYPEMVAVS